MNKQEFLSTLSSWLFGIGEEDVNRSLDYYSEMIDDRMEDGLSEEDAVAAIGTPEEVAEQILIETPLPKLVKAKVKPERTLKVWEIVLIALGSPVWIPLLLALIIVILAVYIVLWSVMVSLYAVAVGLGVCALGGVVGGGVLVFFGKIAQGVAFFGAGLVCAGLTVLLFILFNLIAKYFVILSKKIWLCIKKPFIRKGEVQ